MFMRLNAKDQPQMTEAEEEAMGVLTMNSFTTVVPNQQVLPENNQRSGRCCAMAPNHATVASLIVGATRLATGSRSTPDHCTLIVRRML